MPTPPSVTLEDIMFYDYQILEITDGSLKKKYTEQVLRLLPEWFGCEESLVEYVQTVEKYPFFGAFKDEACVGFFSGVIYHGRTGDIYVCGIHPTHHRKGLGRALYQTLETYFKAQGCAYIMVKTLSPLHPDKHYALTRKFYEAVGFKDFYTDHDMWGKENPCLIMVKNLV